MSLKCTVQTAKDSRKPAPRPPSCPLSPSLSLSPKVGGLQINGGGKKRRCGGRRDGIDRRVFHSPVTESERRDRDEEKKKKESIK